MCNSTTCPNNKSWVGADFLCHCKPHGATHYRKNGNGFSGGYLKYDNKNGEWYAWEFIGKEWLPVSFIKWTKDAVKCNKKDSIL